jgi:outer membrane protein
MKKQIFAAAALAAATLVSGNAFAQAKEGPWMVRVRAVNLNSANSDTTGLGLSINSKTMPEVDVSYFIDKNIAVELVLTVPQEHTLSSSVVGGSIGTLEHLPPTLLVQYHFDAPGFRPYVGAGINYTRFSSVNLTVPGADIDRNSYGAALQAGVDIPLSGNMYLNFDIKKVYIGTDVSLNGAKIGTFKVDPVLVGIGLGWRF